MNYIDNSPEFLNVKLGDPVIIGENEIAKVLTFIRGSKDPDAPTLSQAANEDRPEINTLGSRWESKGHCFC